jgi:nicotinate-nucleotide adenylyltransferase
MSKKIQAKKRVVLFGGSFNPPHQGHYHIAAKAHQAMNSDEVWMLVAPRNPEKSADSYADLAHRKTMSELMTKNDPWLKVSDIEQSYVEPGKDYIETANTLKKLQSDYPDHEFIWMMGSDNVVTFHTWTDWQSIVDNHLIMVMNRTQSTQELNAVKNAYAVKNSQVDLAVHDKGRAFKKDRGFYLVDSPVYDMSSTAIRKNLNQIKPCLTGLFNDVADYIEKESLYNYGQDPVPVTKASKEPKPKR